MSQTSASEPAIMAMPVEVLETTMQNTKPQQIHRTGTRGQDKHKAMPVLSTSTISETSDHSSSLLWTPQNLPTTHSTRSNARRSHRKKNARRLYKQEMSSMTEETSPFLSTQGQEARGTKEKNLCSFERDYPQNRYSYTRRSGRNLEKNSLRRSPKHKRTHPLYNDYTKYQYHRRSHRDKHKKRKSLHERKEEPQRRAKNGLPKIIQRIKDFFLGKKTNKESYHMNKEVKEYDETHFEGHSRPVKNNHCREPSGRLFRSASDSDIEVVKHHHRRKHRNTPETQDDLFKNQKHWKMKRFHGDNKLSSICESSDKTGGLERRSGSDGRLVLAKSGNTTYNDIKFHNGHKHSEHTHAREERKSRHRKKEEKDTSDGSHSIRSSRNKGRHRKRSKDYQSLKKKWAKQHQSFENDLEKLEKLVELINMKNPQGWLEQKPSENTTLLERLEAKQEKCVAEVDFTRHVLICKLQRLENKLEESLSAVDYNNNTTEERESSIAELREEMSNECRDLRKLLQETSDQLKQVLQEKTGITSSEKRTIITEGQKTDENEFENVHQECGQKSLNEGRETRSKDALGNPDIPFPELSHHPLNKGYPRHQRMDSHKKTEDKRHKPTRISTYV